MILQTEQLNSSNYSDSAGSRVGDQLGPDLARTPSVQSVKPAHLHFEGAIKQHAADYMPSTRERMVDEGATTLEGSQRPGQRSVYVTESGLDSSASERRRPPRSAWWPRRTTGRSLSTP